MSRKYQLPQGRRIHVYRSGDGHFEGTKVTYNPFLYKKHEKFLDEVARKVPVFGAVRSIHTPNTGTEVTNLLQLKKEGRYVAAGPKGFISIPGGYETIGKIPFTERMKKEGSQKIVRKTQSRNPAKTIWVFCNGDKDARAQSFEISEGNFEDWHNILYRLSTTIKLATGSVKRLYNLKGKVLDSVESLEDNGYYVAAASNEPFRPSAFNDKGNGLERRHSYDDRTIESIKSPGLKLRVPIRPKIKLKKNMSLTDDDESQGNQSRSSSLSRRGRNGSESKPRTKKGTKKNSQSRGRKPKGSDFSPAEPLSRMSLKDGSHQSPTNSFNSARRRSVSSINEEIGSRQASPEHFYESLSQYNPDTDEDDQEKFKEDEQEDESGLDSGRGSLLLSDESRPGSVFKAKHKSRPSTTMSVDYDTDEGGIFRAKSSSDFTSNAITILEDSKTKIEVPIDLMEAKEVMEEVY